MRLIIIPKNGESMVFSNLTKRDINVFEFWYNSVGAKLFGTQTRIDNKDGSGEYAVMSKNDIDFYRVIGDEKKGKKK